MSNKNNKLLRGLVRTVVKETFPEIFTSEVKTQLLKEISPMVESILSNIRQELVAAVERQNKLTQFKENELLTEANLHLKHMNLVMDIWQKVLAEKLELAAVVGPDFIEELKERIKQAQELNSKEITNE